MADSPKRTRKQYILLLASLFITLCILVILSLCLGQYKIAPLECARILFSKLLGLSSGAPTIQQNVILRLRLPRTLAAALVGGALAMSGAVYQGVFSNPLVSPDLLGVSSGACVGAACAILLGLSSASQTGMAFMGGIAAVALTFLLPRLMRKTTNMSLVLSGIVVGGFMSSAVGLLKYLADPQTQLAQITYWQLGSFATVSLNDLTFVFPVILAAGIVLYALSWWIDVISLGESEARAVGANVPAIRALCILLSTILTACSICISGTISWVGLVIPHISRMFTGTRHRMLLPVCFLMGACFMTCIDTAARTLTMLELPVSVLTGAIGAPVYALILCRRRGML